MYLDKLAFDVRKHTCEICFFFSFSLFVIECQWSHRRGSLCTKLNQQLSEIKYLRFFLFSLVLFDFPITFSILFVFVIFVPDSIVRFAAITHTIVMRTLHFH